MAKIPTLGKWCNLLFLLLWNACATYDGVAIKSQHELNQRFKGKQFWLKQSLFAGQFYDDARFKLANPKPFERLTYLTALDGEIITPPSADEIIPAGAKVTVEAIEWPTGDIVTRRPFYTPRYHTWLYFRIIRDENEITHRQQKPYILLIPNTITTQNSAQAWIEKFITTENQEQWIKSLNKSIQDAITFKRVMVGMTKKELFVSLGDPDSLTTKPREHGMSATHTDFANYGPTTIVLRDDVVVDIKSLN